VAVLKQFSVSGKLDARGVTISDALLKEIFDAAPHDADGHRTFSAIQFIGAKFEGDAGFAGATFKSDAGFIWATFKRNAEFDGATFEGVAEFSGAKFEGDTQFKKATFRSDTKFTGTTFKRNAEFDEATFKGATQFEKARFNDYAGFAEVAFEGAAEFDEASFKGGTVFGFVKFEKAVNLQRATFEDIARFDKATFVGPVRFNDATFKSDAVFAGATFKDTAWFGGVTFEGYTAFNDKATFEGAAGFKGATFKDATWFRATFGDTARFDEVTFKGTTTFDRVTFKGNAEFSGAMFKVEMPVLGPITVRGRLDLDGAQFAAAVRIEADASEVTCRRGVFPGGVRFDVLRAAVRLDNTDFSEVSSLTGPPVSDMAGIAGRPNLLSLQGANVAGLALGNVSLADCRFAGAHNLDKLRLEADAVFDLSPAVASWERRQIIADEKAWRATKTRPGRWELPSGPDSEDQPKPLSPGAITGLYRALRKNREDAKDEPGATDFYYGEMEMRRHDRGPGDANRWRGRASRIVLTVYWLVSGYGQRASRALAALAVVTALFAIAFHYIGFTQPPEPVSYWTSLLYAFRSTISLTDSQVTLTAWGSFFQALLRITGPVLFGLMLLALRNRVKR
jgi:uncharacterized protein YjbI with pentapeptide repeats